MAVTFGYVTNCAECDTCGAGNSCEQKSFLAGKTHGRASRPARRVEHRWRAARHSFYLMRRPIFQENRPLKKEETRAAPTVVRINFGQASR
ncbi:MAG: hypothetical protein CMJ58_19940 [Planctomycetaceae bacterium]|nr:hypothetical protein [Planctomycetaceae bacterium]